MVGQPRPDRPGPVFAGFQLMTTLLLLAAASSSFQAGPGLLKALSRDKRSDGSVSGVLPAGLGRTNTHHTPFRGVLVVLIAVSVFLSFLAGLIAMAVFSRRQHPPSHVHS